MSDRSAASGGGARRRRGPLWSRGALPLAVLLAGLGASLGGVAAGGLPAAGAGAGAAAAPAAGATGRLVATVSVGSPAVTAAPTTASAPATVTLVATGFRATGPPVSCGFTAGTPPTTATLALATGGSATGTIDLTADDAVGTNPIVCSQQPATGTALVATATFAVDQLATGCQYGSTPPAATCGAGQSVGATVGGSDLTVSDVLDTTPNATGGVNPTRESVVLSSVTLGDAGTMPACSAATTPGPCGASQFAVATGHLNSVLVQDDRGNLSGWTVTGQLATTFEGPPVGHNHVIPADFLAWEPSVSASTSSCTTLGPATACVPSDVATQVASGPVAHLSTTTGRLLCQAATGGGGGDTKCTAALYLAVPPYIAAGHYTTTMDIVVS